MGAWEITPRTGVLAYKIQIQGLMDTILGSYFLGLKDTDCFEDLTKGLCGPYTLAYFQPDYSLTRLVAAFSTQNWVLKPMKNPKSIWNPYSTKIPLWFMF